MRGEHGSPMTGDKASLAGGTEKHRRPRPSTFLALGSALLYGFTAISMNFVNKYTMQVFPLSNVVLVLQMAATYFIIQFLQVMGITNFPPFSWHKCRALFGITVLYTANTGFALFGLKSLNVPMYNVLKRLTPIIVLTCKACLYKRMPPLEITLSVLMVVAGCIVAGMGDLTFELVGYLCAFASCLTQAAYLLLVEVQGNAGCDTTELLFYNSATSLPLLAGLVWVSGEAAQIPTAWAAAVTSAGTFWAWGAVTSCSLLGMLLNYALFLCTTSNSALTTTIVGVLKGVVAVALGFFLLGGIQTNATNLAGIGLNTAGGIWYTVIKYQQKSEQKRSMVVSASADPLTSLPSSASVLDLAKLGGYSVGRSQPQVHAQQDMEGGGLAEHQLSEGTGLKQPLLGSRQAGTLSNGQAMRRYQDS